ncbi:MAG: hypothetical protein AB7K71_40970 [Polyangiaceae bacterium]
MRRIAVGVTFIALLSTTVLAEPAFAAAPEADAEPNLAKARRLAAEGIERFHQQRYREAKKLLVAAEQLHPAAVHKVYLARCAAIERALLEAARLYALAEREGDGSEVGEVAARERREVLARIPHLIVSVPERTAATSVRLDGEVADWSVARGLAVDPGVHVLERVDGSHRRTRTLRVAEGGDVHVELLPPPKARALEHPSPESTPNTAAWVAFGLGGVSSLVGAITGTLVLLRSSDLKRECAKGCPASRQQELEDTRRLGDLSTVAFVVGGVGLGTGFVLWAAPSGSERASVVSLAGSF